MVKYYRHLQKMYFLLCLVFIISSASTLPYAHKGAKIFGFSLNNISIGNYDPEDTIKHVIGGNDAEPGEFPFQVSLQIIPSSGPVYHNCGGIIFDEYHIVTAAHCVVGKNLTRMDIVAGAHNIKDNNERFQQRVRAKRSMHHPQYKGSTSTHDGAVITLASPLVFNSRVQPLRLAPENHEPMDSSSCVTIGWGSTGQPGVVPDALQKVALNIINRETCQKLYSGINYVDQSMICAGGSHEKGSCTGDSGGPILCSDIDGEIYMAGLVSWTVLPCGQLRFPTVFSNIAFLRPFLNCELVRP